MSRYRSRALPPHMNRWFAALSLPRPTHRLRSLSSPQHHTLRADLRDRQQLLKIIKPQGKIKAVVYGHSHQYGYSEYAGIHLINLPSTGYTIWADAPLGWVDAKLTARGGEFTLHAVDGDRALDGHRQTLFWRT